MDETKPSEPLKSGRKFRFMTRATKSVYAAPLLVLWLMVGTVGLVQVFKTQSLGQSPWNLGEWLINYSGGFVRRGLPGEVASLLSGVFNISPAIVVWFFSIASYLALLFVSWGICKNLIPPVLFLSPVLFLAPVLTSGLVKKDAFLLLCFALTLNQVTEISDFSNPLNKRVLALNLICVVALLTHESFFFFALPTLVLLAGETSTRRRCISCKSLLAGAARLSPALTTAGLTLIFKGTQAQSQKIWQSWSSFSDTWLGRDFFPPSPPSEGAIQAIGWTTAEGLSLSASILDDFHGIFWDPLIWIITTSCVGLFLSCVVFRTLEKSKVHQALIFQFLCITPLFALGWDFGRWIVLWSISSSLLICTLTRIEHRSNLTSKRPATATSNSVNLPLNAKISALIPFFGIPACCWQFEYFWTSSAAGYLANLFGVG